MSVISDQQIMERLKFFDGQRLFAQDLQAIDGFQREMRQLHNSSLHQIGIGNGFAVSGVPGDREVTIGPGYAIDIWGREIVHTRTRREPIPPVQADDDGKPAAFYLSVFYPSDAGLEESETRAGICVGPGVVRLSEEPIFCWVRLERTVDGLKPADPLIAQKIASGERILLAQITVLDCKLQSLSVGPRRNARPAARPNIVCGRLSPPDWNVVTQEIWPDGTSDWGQYQIVLLEAAVSIADANFVGVPSYLARIEGPRILEWPLTQGNGKVKCLAESLVSVKAPTRDGFTLLAITMLISPKQLKPVTRDMFKVWSIIWMGIE